MRRVFATTAGSQTGQVSDDVYRPAPRWPRIAITVLGLASAVAATMCVIKAGGAAIASDIISGPAETRRTVVATAGPGTPTAAPLDAERPVLLQANSAAGAQPTDLREIVYTIAGNQRPNDPVTVVYADETGTLQTLHNVTLPWTMTVIPGVPVNYVTANSTGSQLNCWITDAGGTTVARQTDFGRSTTCNR